METLAALFSLADDISFYPKSEYDTRWKRLLARALALVFLVFLVHFPLTDAKPLWADQPGVTHDMSTHSSHWLAIAWLQPHLWSRPPLARTLTFLLNQLAGDRPDVPSDSVLVQMVNLCLYSADALLLWLLLRRLQVPGAWLAAAVVAVQPMNVQALAWIGQQERLWGATFGLGSLLLVLRGGWVPVPPRLEYMTPRGPVIIRLGRSPEATVLIWSSAAFLFLAALLCQPTLIGLPLLAMALLIWKKGISKYRSRIGLAMLVAAIFMLLIGFAGDSISVRALIRSHQLSLLWQFVSASFNTIDEGIRLCGRAIWPFPTISANVPSWFGASAFQRYGPIAALAAVGGILTIWRKRLGAAPLVVLVCSLCLFPTAWDKSDWQVTQWIPGRDAAQYVLSIPFIVAIVAGLCLLFTRLRSELWLTAARLLLGILLLSSLGTISWLTSGEYDSTESAWMTAIANSSGSYLPRTRLAAWYLESGNLAGAKEQIAFVNPELLKNPEAFITYGQVMQADGRFPEAVAAFGRASELDPTDSKSLRYRAGALTAEGDDNQAKDSLQRALTTFPNDPDLLDDYGVILQRLGHSSLALEQFQRAVAADPNSVSARVNLANALFVQGNLQDAADQLQEVVKLDPWNYEAFHNAGVMLCKLGDPSKAEPLLRAAIRLRPDSAEGHNDLGVALFMLKNVTEAVAEFHASVGLKPNYVDAQRNLQLAQRELSRGPEVPIATDVSR